MAKHRGKDEEEKQHQTSWKDFIYDRRSGEFMGRTASGWALIILFYLVFYGFLAGMFTLTMWVMLQTLDDYTPRYQDRVANPGLVIRPKTMDILFNRSEPLNYGPYVEQLESFLHQYDDMEQKNEQCVAGQFFEQDTHPQKKACQFSRSVLGPCSGLLDPNFGYPQGEPCVLVKMNRVIGLKPRGDPHINCTAKNEGSVQMQYYPIEGKFDRMYFPYYGKKAQETYVQPLVAVKLLLTKENYNTELTVECKIEGTNLRNDDDRDKFQGRVTFKLTVTE
ncbi:sodium/potassium-transporting ATPase subunit beta-3a [Paramormyrops kingsleyae]|uniref:sodium/potassium-transporting ATPase subunit beta-3a n=1 Tax=Paramormyrops kingsleyae TaxID=1676925 RepID=UPI003B96B602